MKELLSAVVRPGATLVFSVGYVAASLWYPEAVTQLKDPMLLTLAFWFGSRGVEKVLKNGNPHPPGV